jgi:hypothetical protein
MEGKRYPRGRNKKRVGERRDITRILAKWDGKTVNAEAERGRSGDDVEGRKNDEGVRCIYITGSGNARSG